MPQSVEWLETFGRYAPGNRWQHLKPPRKKEQGKDKPKVSIPTSWNDDAKDLTNQILGDNPDLKKSVQWNVGTVYMDMASLVRIAEKILAQGIGLPAFYQKEVLPHMLQNDLSSSVAVVVSNETLPKVVSQDKVLQDQEGSATSHTQCQKYRLLTSHRKIRIVLY
ncbi:hypothetical protein [Candidatus Tisiphia endosymbiont of Nemotelus uliginosus]|uniref:hypothetical protein n=1 Tax=Candidatus Tisiphia endosymbiont of Nemotelus uliginosus TaxID=3077926 RepID=UPI0035C9019C